MMNELEKIFLKDQALLKLVWKSFENLGTRCSSNHYTGDEWTVIFKSTEKRGMKCIHTVHFLLNKPDEPWVLALTLDISELSARFMNIAVTYEYTNLETHVSDTDGNGLVYFAGQTKTAEIQDMVFNVIDEMCNKYHIEIHKDENPKMVLIHILLRYLHTKDTVK